MQESSKVNVQLTSKDIKDFSISKSFQNKFSKTKFFFIGFITIMFIFLIFLSISVQPIDGVTIKLIFILIAAYLFFISIIFSPVIINYLSNIYNYKKSVLLQNLHCYNIVDNGIFFSSSREKYTFTWSEIRKIQELNPCFLIVDTSGKYYIIPKRCFDNAAHLNNFISIIFSKLERNKFKLTGSKFDKFSPESGNLVVLQENQVSMPEDTSEPFSETKFMLNKKELIKVNYKIYYANPLGIIVSILGMLFLTSFMRMILQGSIYLPSLLFALSLGTLFTIFIPVSIYINTSNRFKKSDMLKSPYIYKFYSDYFTINHPSGCGQVRWSDLVKAVEQKSSILFYVTTQTAHIIPKSVFQDNEEQLKLLRKVVSEKSPKVKMSI